MGSVSQLELVAHQAVIGAPAVDERLVVAGLDDLSPLDHDDLVRVADGAQPVGDDDDGLALVEGVQVPDDRLLVVGVERVRGLVEEDIVRILVDGPGDEDALLLPLAQPDPVGADHRVVAEGQALDELLDVGDLHGPRQPGGVDRPVVDGDVAGDRLGEDHAVLHDDTALPPPPFLVELAQGGPADADLAGQQGIKAQEELDEGRLAAPAGADDGGHLAPRYRQAYPVDRFPGGVRVV